MMAPAKNGRSDMPPIPMPDGVGGAGAPPAAAPAGGSSEGAAGSGSDQLQALQEAGYHLAEQNTSAEDGGEEMGGMEGMGDMPPMPSSMANPDAEPGDSGVKSEGGDAPPATLAAQ